MIDEKNLMDLLRLETKQYEEEEMIAQHFEVLEEAKRRIQIRFAKYLLDANTPILEIVKMTELKYYEIENINNNNK